MQIQCIFVLLAFGTEGRHVSRRAVFDPYPVHTRMTTLQERINSIDEKTDVALEKIVQDIEKKKNNCATTLSKELQDPADKFKAKLKEELAQAIKEGNDKDAAKIEVCVTEEQARYVVEFAENYQISLVCVTKATEIAKKEIQRVKNAFYRNSYAGRLQANLMTKKWKHCLTPNTNYLCVEMTDNEFWKRITHTQKVSTETIEKGKAIIPKHKNETDLCVNEYKKQLANLEEIHKEIVWECIKDPEAKMTWKFNWIL